MKSSPNLLDNLVLCKEMDLVSVDLLDSGYPTLTQEFGQHYSLILLGTLNEHATLTHTRLTLSLCFKPNPQKLNPSALIDRQFTMMRSPNRASLAPVAQEIFPGDLLIP
ncbi:hypothetical protein [Pantanalinema sp. GBBB05]|uniref:hypothetical protein n=1 Tax=Pantanalinema sp. GBBB05 TaxID=2604139 RepID=UPI001DBE96B4|nr:hypothetical protein [Pantanalinema sp. GBBB05]